MFICIALQIFVLGMVETLWIHFWNKILHILDWRFYARFFFYFFIFLRSLYMWRNKTQNINSIIFPLLYRYHSIDIDFHLFWCFYLPFFSVICLCLMAHFDCCDFLELTHFAIETTKTINWYQNIISWTSKILERKIVWLNLITVTLNQFDKIQLSKNAYVFWSKFWV